MLKQVIIVCALTVAATSAVPAAANAAAITFLRSTSVTANLDPGTSARFDGGGVEILCTRHTVRALAFDLNLTGSRLGIRGGNNVYSNAATPPNSCTYTFLGLGSGRVSVSLFIGQVCDWVLTATSTTAGNITIPANCTTLSFTDGPLAGGRCSNDLITVNVTTNTVTPVSRLRTAMSIIADRVRVVFTCVGLPVRSIDATQTETLTISTVSVS
jgi:hypothetical protein